MATAGGMFDAVSGCGMTVFLLDLLRVALVVGVLILLVTILNLWGMR